MISPIAGMIIGGLIFLCFILLILVLKKKSSGGESEALRQMQFRLEQLDQMSRQLAEMNRVFNNPRLRGGIGETMMEELIQNWLPTGTYKLQYGFSGGQRADAVLFMGNYKVAVDAKFSMEQVASHLDKQAESGKKELPPSVQNVFIKHAKSIAEKYIRPKEGTLPFALMYIPSENIYYQSFIACGGELMDRCLKMGILPVSPSSLFVYLQTIVYGYRGFSFSNRSRELMNLVEQVKQDYENLARQFDVTGSHLKNLHKSWDEAATRMTQMDRTIKSMDS